MSILGIPRTYIVSTIFRTIETDAKGLSNQLGILGKSFKTIKTDLSQGFGVGFSLFGGNGKGISQSDISAINAYYRELDNCVSKQTAWNRTMLNTSKAAQSMVINANGARISTEQLGQAQELTRWQTIKLTAASVALNAAISLGVSVLLSLAIKTFTHLYSIQDKLAEKTKELTSSLKSQTDEYNNLKSELDEVNKKLKDNESRYSELIEKQKKSGLTTEESGELEELQRITGELTNQKNILEENIRLKKESAASTAQELANTLLKQEDVKSFMDGAGGKIKSFFNEIQESSIKMIPGFGKLYSVIDTVISLFNVEIPKDSWLNKIANIFDGTAIISWLTGTDIEEDSYDEAVSKYEDLQKKMKVIRDKYDKNGDGIIDSDSSMSSEDSETYKKYYDESVEVANNLKTEYQELDDAIKAIEADTNLTQVNKKELERLKAARDIIAEILGYNNEGKTGDGIISDEDVKDVDKMTISLSDLEKASDKIKTLNSAFKELSDDGYITTKTLGEIQTATGLTGDEWAKYENKLLNAKKGSTEFNQLMSELTYKILENTFGTKGLANATEEQISAVLRENGVTNASAVAHQVSTRAKYEEYLQTIDLNNVTAEETNQLLMLAQQCGATQQQIGFLTTAMEVLASTDLNLADKSAQLLQMAASAGVAMVAVGEASSILAGMQSGSAGALKMQEYSGKSMTDIYKSSIQEILAYFGGLGSQISGIRPRYSGGKTKGGGDGGSNNKPDKKDDTDAIINRINLRSKELEQQEEDIENSIEISALEKDYNKQISLTNDLIGARKTRVKELQLANVNLHNEAEKLRNNTEQWNEEEWFDSQGNTTEAYIDLYNKSSKSQQELMEEQFEKISKYKKAYLDNAEEISEINKQLIQDEEDLSELYHSLYEATVADIEHNKEMVLNKDPFADITSFYTQLQEEYHKEAERLRALDPEKYKEEIQKLQQQWWDAEQGKSDWRWDNSQRWIEQRNTFNDWKLFDDSEIKAWERVVKWLKEEYPNDLERIQEAEKSLFEARKAEFEKANDFANTYLDSRKTLLQSYYDVANAVAEAQHEINKELETSKTMYEWLNEDTRTLLFNQEDYNILSEELYDIQHKADKLQREYQRALASSSLETIESITSQYEMQYETLMKSYEIAKADLEIAKKKQKLNNVLNERNVRMFINGQWQWVANTEDVINAKAELADAEYAKRVEEAGLTQQQSIDNLTRRQDELTVVINKFENGIISLDEAVTLAKEAIGSLPNALYSIYGNSSSKSKNSYSVNSTSGGRTFYVGADGNAPKVATIGDTIKTSDGDYKIVPAGTYGAKYNSSSGRWSIKIKEKNAKGNRYTAGGMTLMGEIKDEMLISNDGHIIPINQPTIANIGTGGIVFNHEQMEAARKIWDMTNLSIPNYSNLMNRTSNITEHTIDNRIIINGMTVDSGSADGQALINALRRYVGNH